MRNLRFIFSLFYLGLGSVLQAQPTFSLPSQTITCAAQNCFEVSVRDFDNILSFQFSINWDANILTNAQIQDFGLNDLNASNFNVATPGTIRVGWDHAQATGIDLNDGHVLFVICFDEAGETNTQSAIQFSGTPIQIEVVNGQGEILDPVFENADLTFNCSNLGDEPLPLGFSILSDTVNCGDQVCLDVRVQGFNEITSFRCNLQWDLNVLKNQTLSDMQLAGLRFGQVSPGSMWAE